MRSQRGIEMVADELPAPVGPEFRLLYDQQNYGLAMPEALHQFAQRVMLLDARFFVTAVLIQRESGGNLAEVLDKLAGVVRDRHKVKRQMRVVSAHGRITGWILVCLPPVLFLVMMIAGCRLSNDYVRDSARCPDAVGRPDPSDHRHTDHSSDYQPGVLSNA